MRRIVALVFALIAVPTGSALAATRTDGSSPASSRVVKLVTTVPRHTLDQIAAGDVLGQSAFEVSKLNGSQLTKGGKPDLLTVNLAWCPHCAANSWALAVALSRFGTLSDLRTIDTGTLFGSPNPIYPHTHGLSFFKARYSSHYLAFTAVVLQDVKGHDLQSLTPGQAAAINSFDSQGISPAVDVGGIYGFVNSGYSPGALAHKSWLQIAGSLANPHNSIARRVDGLANLFAAGICKATHGRPSSVCTSHGVSVAGHPRLG